MLKTISKEKVDKYIESMVDRITSKFSPEKIKEMRRGINKLLADREMPVDIIVISSEKMELRRDIPGTLPYICVREGELLYEREG